MTQRITTTITAFALFAFLIFISVVHSASRAQALSSDGHGPGYFSSDGWWLGSYTLDDGSRGFCLHAGRPSPVGHGVDYVEGATLDWFSPEQAAKLAYISRTWAGTSDRTTAAAGQIATWIISGLNGKSAESYAARAGADAATVLNRARSMVDEAGRQASSAVTATTTVELSEAGPGRARVELAVEWLSGTAMLPPEVHRARLELTGALFEDGTASATVANGVDVAIVPTGTDQTVSVTATATFDGLPYGDRLRVAVADGDFQSLLVAIPATAEASAEVETTGVSPLPFQPRVTTVTSAAEAMPGATITDHLTVEAEQGDGLLPTWAVWSSLDGLEPVEATIESTLLGPFHDAITPAPTAPEGAPVVCTVEVVVTGPGEYETPGCSLPAPGLYVWVEKIDPARTPADQGGSRMRPWQSSFGIASEITSVSAPVPVLAATGSEPAATPWIGGGALIVGTAIAFLSALRRRRSAHTFDGAPE
jgi:hypothetical protein